MRIEKKRWIERERERERERRERERGERERSTQALNRKNDDVVCDDLLLFIMFRDVAYFENAIC
jgi:hypothetical protein